MLGLLFFLFLDSYFFYNLRSYVTDSELDIKPQLEGNVVKAMRLGEILLDLLAYFIDVMISLALRHGLLSLEVLLEMVEIALKELVQI